MIRVLLVDDEREFVATLAERLRIRDIDADWAVTPAEALEAVSCKSYDIAILDVKLPNTSGIELKKALERISPEMEFVFVTGHGSEENFEEGVIETGPDCYMVKPVSIERLIATMEAVLGEKK